MKKTFEQLKKEFIIDTPVTFLEKRLEKLVRKGVRIVVPPKSENRKPYVEFTKPYTHNKKELEKEAWEIYKIIQ